MTCDITIDSRDALTSKRPAAKTEKTILRLSNNLANNLNTKQTYKHI